MKMSYLGKPLNFMDESETVLCNERKLIGQFCIQGKSDS